MTSLIVKELLQNLRDRRFLWQAALVLILGIVAVVGGHWEQQAAQSERRSFQQQVDQQWADQPDRHPHRVAHYGTFAFRVPSLWTAFDLGVDRFLGNSIFLEAHKQNPPNFSQARHSSGLLRFGQFCPASILQLLFPLLIVMAGFASVSGERESGMLTILLSQGLSERRLLAGKVAALFLLSLGLAAPLVGLFALTLGRSGSADAEFWPRLVTLAVSYCLYLLTWALLTVLVSRESRNSTTSLVVLLALWALLVIFVPRLLPSLGERLYPSPSSQEFAAAMHADVIRHGDGHHHADQQFEQMKKDLLERHGVSRLEDLPVNFKGIAMRRGEELSAEVYDKHYRRLQEIYQAQNRLVEFGAFFDPLLAIQPVSSAVCATDFEHFVDFQRRAEEHRFKMVDRLNQLHTEAIRFEDDRRQRISREHWQDFPPFRWSSRGLFWGLSNHGLALTALVGWPLLLMVGLFASQNWTREDR